MNFDLFQTCSRLCPSWLSSQPAAACTGKRSAACWMNAWPSFTPTWTEDLPTLRGSCRAGCPCPASGRSLTHLHAVQFCVCTQGEDDTGFNLTRQIKKKKKTGKKRWHHTGKRNTRGIQCDMMQTAQYCLEIFTSVFLFVCCLGRGTELTERSRTSSTKWFRNGGALKRKQMTSCRPSWTPHTSKVTSAAQNKR